MKQENRKCENCGRQMPRAAYIPFNGGVTVCFPCCDEWESLGSPKTIAEYHEAVYKRQDNQTDLTAEK